mgnify:CR=1 FL=1
MIKSTITATSSFALLIALASNASAGGLNDAIAETKVVQPASVNLCTPSRNVDLRFGALQSDNVWEDEIETRGFDENDKVGLGDSRDMAEGGFADFAFDWDRCDSSLAIGAGFATVDMAEDGAENNRIEDKATLSYLDVSYGRPLGDSFHYFGGLRILNFESESSLDLTPFPTVNSEAEASFTGFGPIVGVSYETPNRSQGQFGFFGKASAAALFGSLRHEEQGSAFGTLNPFTSGETTEESNETIVSLDAELGAFYKVTDSSAVSLGIAYKRLNDIDFVSSNLAESDDKSFETGDREFLGAFIGYSYRF